MEALLKAVEHAGGQSALARACGVRQGHVWMWLNRDGGRPPLDRCPAIEGAIHGKVRCEDLRPDVQWQRDPDTDQVTGYVVAIEPAPTTDAATENATSAPPAGASAPESTAAAPRSPAAAPPTPQARAA